MSDDGGGPRGVGPLSSFDLQPRLRNWIRGGAFRVPPCSPRLESRPPPPLHVPEERTRRRFPGGVLVLGMDGAKVGVGTNPPPIELKRTKTRVGGDRMGRSTHPFPSPCIASPAEDGPERGWVSSSASVVSRGVDGRGGCAASVAIPGSRQVVRTRVRLLRGPSRPS
eukprot:scaffold800_cov327-Pavlova_lutheri.AAC.7